MMDIKLCETPVFQGYECHQQIVYCDYGSVEIFNEDGKYDIWLCNLYVTKEYRSKGIGSKLIKRALQLCKKRNIKKVLLDCDHDLEGWYVSLGFKIRDHYINGSTMVFELL